MWIRHKNKSTSKTSDVDIYAMWSISKQFPTEIPRYMRPMGHITHCLSYSSTVTGLIFVLCGIRFMLYFSALFPELKYSKTGKHLNW